MNRKLTAARRDVERLRLEASGATETDVQIWQASNRVADLEHAERQAAVQTARRAALVMDVVLGVVALLTMAFSLQNIHDFAADHGVQDPIAWFLAPAVDLALIAALLGDAVLSRHQLDAGPWATRLRWFAGAATLGLNVWHSVAVLDPAAIVLHAVPPILLFVLAEAASPYRSRFAETVRLAAEAAAAEVDKTEVDTPAPAEVDTAPAADPEPVDDPAPAPAVSTQTPQVETPERLRSVPAPAEVDTPAKGRLSAAAAKAAIEAAWTEGLTIREAAERATRAPSYVGQVYARLTRERGIQPSRGQMRIEGEAA
ncbi:DUF2637 domain-containing protein [Streptomyces sp. CNQ085]|uniref:DUF2637 domain-containing protein n=1 Tax=Streptomyces sp. CNQ085 TaxID=2886944 RepID=UPI001F50A411|nr:DUF2637 domain-containing protein [Streptomyces sp. CNQ085]MCI0387046.1 DUF2637 domain-containing protein [Streptomyces sp. CNQ085]